MTATASGTGVGSIALAVATLRDLGMPSAEIDAILEADDPRLVRRYLQLHAERLEERLRAQRAALLKVEPFLASRSTGTGRRTGAFASVHMGPRNPRTVFDVLSE